MRISDEDYLKQTEPEQSESKISHISFILSLLMNGNKDVRKLARCTEKFSLKTSH